MESSISTAGMHGMVPKHAATILLSLTLAYGCRPADRDAAPQEWDALYFESIGRGQSGALTDTTEVVLRDSSDWAELRQSLRPRAPFAEVDFSQSMVFVAALPQTSGGYEVQFDGVDISDSVIVASYVLSEPASNCLTTMALTLPFDAIAVRKAEGAVTFRRRIERVSCSLD